VRTYEFQISDKSDFSTAVTSNVAGFAAVVSKTGVAEGTDGKTSFTPEQDLQPTTRYYWRARMTQGSVTSDWSATRKFNSKLVGYVRGGELYDPLIHSETVGERVGSTDFIPGKGIRLNDNTSYVKYRLPQTIGSGEFSMEVEGLRPDAPGNKSKVFGMQEGQDDFIVNRYRVDAQYRGSSGSPPNAITWRAMFGSDDEKLEPDTAIRYASALAAVSLERHVEQQRLPPGGARRRADWRGTLQPGRYGRARGVQPEPPLRVPRHAHRSQRS
jgi:hypothetical protein